MKSVFFLSLFFVAAVVARKGVGPTDQEWGYVTVRENAHMFWWFHSTLANVKNITERPLVIWLQGGPGSSSTGYGNFAELGPLDTDLNPRNTTWLNHVNLLFVDNPVGTGYSYVEDSAYATTNRQIAEDFVELLRGFYATLPEFETVPLYIFSESYGGKMTAEIALVLHNAIQQGNISCDLRGIGLGDSWISPIDSVKTWAPYLLNLGIIDGDGYKAIMAAANETEAAILEGNYEQATSMWSYAEYVVQAASNYVDFYNVLTRNTLSSSTVQKPAVDPNADKKVNGLMTGVVQRALNVSHVWQSQSNGVSEYLTSDFMRPVISIVEEILNSTDIQVAVYNGQLDLIVDTLGTVAWVEKMNWNTKPLWQSAGRNGFINDGYYEGYVQKAENFAFYWVDRAGHMVPADNPSAMYYILRDVTDNFSV